MLCAFDRNEMQVRAYGSFGNGRRVCRVVLLSLHERLHVDWRDQTNLMTFCAGKSAPVMARRARFHGNDTAGMLLE